MSDSPTKPNTGVTETKTENKENKVEVISKEEQTPTEATKSGQTPDLPATPTVQASYYNPEKEIDKLYKLDWKRENCKS